MTTQDGIETVKETNDIKLSNLELLVMEQMNKGMYAIYVADTEWLSSDGRGKNHGLKAGTIKRLMDFGLIEVSPVNYTRHLLTDKGRSYR